MTNFIYTGIDHHGRSVTGTLAADNPVSLEQRLQTMGVWLLKAEADKTSDSRRSLRSARLSGGTKRRQLINFCTLMSFMAKVGIPLVQALEIAAQDCDNPVFREVINDLKNQVEAGQKMAEAMEKYPGLFGSQFTSLIRAGEESGSLPESLNELKRYLEWQEQVISDVRQATIYPAVVLMMVILFVLVLFTFVVPRFVTLLTAVRVELPLPTKIVFAASDFAKATWWIWLLAFVVIPLAVTLGTKWSHRFAIAVDHVKFKVPLFGPLNHMLAMSRFARSLSVLYRAGVSLLQGLKLCEDLAGSPVVARDLRDVQHSIEEGSCLSEALRRHPNFSSLLIRMTVMGEKTGNLDGALDNVAEYYNTIIPRRIKKIFSVMEPALILTLVGIVGLVALAIFMPILSLMQSMR
jgi:type IV pilus assembly protein PilC